MLTGLDSKQRIVYLMIIALTTPRKFGKAATLLLEERGCRVSDIEKSSWGEVRRVTIK
jgi:hypothetical protein